MYKSYYYIQEDCIDITSQKIFCPFLDCYFLSNVVVSVNGTNYQEGQGNDFIIENQAIIWNNFEIRQNYVIVVIIDYFYIQKNNKEIMSFIFDFDNQYHDKTRTKSIAITHYSQAQFSLDMGLYKNAVLNYGTVLETLLNKNLSNINLKTLIDQYTGSADKQNMHKIREFRNKVNPNRIFENNDIFRSDAVTARNGLESILKLF